MGRRVSGEADTPAAAAGADRTARRLAIVLGAVFLLKLTVLWQLADHPLLQPEAGLDTTAYANLAQEVLAGNIGLGPGLYYVSPLYIYFLAAGLWLFKSYTAVRVLQIALGTASIAFLFFTTRTWFGDRAAWFAVALGALTGLFTFYEILILQASIDGFLTSAGLWCLTRALHAPAQDGRPRTSSAALYMTLTGVVFGIQTLNRPNVLLAAGGVVLVLLASRRVRPAVLLVTGLLIGMGPAAIRNVVVAHQWSFVSSHGGLNFYIGNGEGATGFYHLVPGIRPTIAGQEEDVRRVAEGAAGKRLTDSEVSNYFFDRAWSWMRDHPATTSWLMVRKLGYVFIAKHVALPHSYPFYAYEERTLLRFLVIGPWLLVPLGLVGLVAAAPREQRADYAAWVSFVPAYAIAVAVFFMAERYRLPLLVTLCAGAGAALSSALPWLPPLGGSSRLGGSTRLVGSSRLGGSTKFNPETKRRSSRATAGALFAALVLFIAVNWPYKLDDGRWEEGLRLAQRLVILHRFDEADRWVQRLEPVGPKPGAAHYGVGMQLLLQGDAGRALPHLETAQRLGPGDPQREYGLGQALLQAGRAREAVAHLRIGFEGGIELPQGGLDYPLALAEAGDLPGAVRAAQRVTPPDSAPDAWLKLGRIAMQAHAPDAAEPFFRRAAALRPGDAAGRLQYGLNLLVLERYADAARELDESARLDPRNPDALSRLAYCELKLGRAADARAHAQAALALAPDDPFTRQLLAAMR